MENIEKCVKCQKYEENSYYKENTYHTSFDFFYNNNHNRTFGSFVCDNCWEIDRGSEESLLQQYIPTESELKEEKQKLMQQLELIHQQGLKGTVREKLEIKQNEQNQLKTMVGNKLADSQKHLLENLLEKQENFDLAVFEDVNQKSAGFLKTQDKLQEVKGKLVAKLSPGEIEEFCRIQTEISKLEIQQRNQREIEQPEQEKFVGQIETVIKQVQKLEQKRENLAKALKIWKEISANQKTSYEEKLTQKQTYIEELEAERATNYENFMDEYGKTIEDFYKRQVINIGDYQKHLQDYIFSKPLQAENEQLKSEIRELKKELANSKLAAKIEIFPKT